MKKKMKTGGGVDPTGAMKAYDKKKAMSKKNGGAVKAKKK